MTEKVLLVGPVPPPNCGVTVPFRIFRDYLERHQGNRRVTVLGLSTRRNLSLSYVPLHVMSRMLTVLRFLLQGFWVNKIVLFVDPRSAVFFGGLASLCFVPLGKQVTIRVWGGSFDQDCLDRSLPARTLIRWILGRNHRIVVETEQSAKNLRQFWPKTLAVVPNFRPAISADEAGRRGRDSEIAFMYTGFVRREKGCYKLVQAFQKVRDDLANRRPELRVRLDLYGHILHDFRKVFPEESLGGVHLHGDVPFTDVLKAYRDADVFTFPTYYPGEGHPGSLVEAMMSGLPVISTRWRAIGELVEDGVNGILVEPKDVDGLAEAMCRLAEDTRLREELGHNARELSRRFETDVVCPKLMEALLI